MPRKFMFTREEIIVGALNLTRKGGSGALTARALGAELGSSSRPIFGLFRNMQEVQQEVFKAAEDLYQSYMKEDMERGKYPPYKAAGMGEVADMVFGLPRVSKELKRLEPYGFRVKSVFALIQSDNHTDSVVYTSRRFQPYAESFSGHYAFVGPSVFSGALPEKKKERPLIYISMGTVINDRPGFYRKCIDALEGLDVDVVISCGNATDRGELGTLADHIRVYPYVDQLAVLARAIFAPVPALSAQRSSLKTLRIHRRARISWMS